MAFKYDIGTKFTMGNPATPTAQYEVLGERVFVSEGFLYPVRRTESGRRDLYYVVREETLDRMKQVHPFEPGWYVRRSLNGGLCDPFFFSDEEEPKGRLGWPDDWFRVTITDTDGDEVFP